MDGNEEVPVGKSGVRELRKSRCRIRKLFKCLVTGIGSVDLYFDLNNSAERFRVRLYTRYSLSFEGLV